MQLAALPIMAAVTTTLLFTPVLGLDSTAQKHDIRALTGVPRTLAAGDEGSVGPSGLEAAEWGRLNATLGACGDKLLLVFVQLPKAGGNLQHLLHRCTRKHKKLLAYGHGA